MTVGPIFCRRETASERLRRAKWIESAADSEGTGRVILKNVGSGGLRKPEKGHHQQNERMSHFSPPEGRVGAQCRL